MGEDTEFNGSNSLGEGGTLATDVQLNECEVPECTAVRRMKEDPEVLESKDEVDAPQFPDTPQTDLQWFGQR